MKIEENKHSNEKRHVNMPYGHRLSGKSTKGQQPMRLLYSGQGNKRMKKKKGFIARQITFAKKSILNLLTASHCLVASVTMTGVFVYRLFSAISL